MEYFQILLAGLTAIILFVFGLEHFTAEIERISGERFRTFLARATRVPAIGVVIGALVTAAIQSSSATSVIAVSLVNSGVLSFENSVGIIFGANIGSTVTAQLVAFKLTAFAPAFVILGFILSLAHSKISVFGKSIFYFGFVFFSLNLISAAVGPLQNEPLLRDYLLQPQNILLAVLVGCLFTALVQSSAVTTGLAIVFAQQGLISLENAIPLVMGANIGTTITALIAMLNMDSAAKKTALSHLIFNVGGVIIALPFLAVFGGMIAAVDVDPAIMLANAHLAFNVINTMIFLAIIKPFTRLVDKLIPDDDLNLQRLAVPEYNQQIAYDAMRVELREKRDELLAYLRETYTLVSLSIESGYRSIAEAASKRLEHVAFLEKEYVSYFSAAVASVVREDDSRDLLELNTQFDYLFQVYDSIDDMFNVKRTLASNYIELEGDVLLMVRGISNHTLALFDDIQSALQERRRPDVAERSRELRRFLDDVNGDLLRLLAWTDRRDAGTLSNLVTFSRRLQDKLVNFSGLLEAEMASPENPRMRSVDA